MKVEDVIAQSAERVLRQLGRRRFDDTRRHSEGLVNALLVHELLRIRPAWRDRFWSEARPFPEEDKERVDIWIDAGPRERTVVIEIKVFDPGSSGNGKYAARGSVVSDFLKLADIVKWKSGAIPAGHMLVFGRTDYWNDQTELCALSQGDGPRDFVGRPKDLVPGKAEQRGAYLQEWFKRGSHAPRRIRVQRVHRSERLGLGVWLWRVSLP